MFIFRLFHKFVLLASALLSAPAFAIMLTWNTLPGQLLYPIKRNLEGYAEIIVSPSYAASVNLQFRLLNRRTWETEQTLAQAIPEALPELTSQADRAQRVIASHPEATSSMHTDELTTQLVLVNHSLEKHKQDFSTSSTPTNTRSTDESPNQVPEKYMIAQIETAQTKLQQTLKSLSN